MSSELAGKRCLPCEGGVPSLDADAVQAHLKQVSERWEVIKDGKAIRADFRFKGYAKTTGFVNAVAWIAMNENHHPDISFGYNTASVLWETHAVEGLTENDFICAAKVDALVDG
ncbi:4a-hydroxytetrahydrobiopterin dehydratase [Abyssibacter profundi]|uniref:Putative pterin-4-alpha-carbinolamine dehydratase n=1 Tax=Abyssibacter profundi TaxID=2182787 RepID=A0A363UPI3_9GAMM|nr:4a-hydroxytetrahydrobiopterin dehydratase [Abyssibacter profundi]MEC9406130.1 4a-hydroxytetrahydrobiopterin dehydratase [Pseudomonadota bacterium]PWN57325.1 4a-hydroxytetrahydrobiopterin dehydratase [Abyssibacter profundi]